jgi:hypothetical protein
MVAEVAGGSFSGGSAYDNSDHPLKAWPICSVHTECYTRP